MPKLKRREYRGYTIAITPGNFFEVWLKDGSYKPLRSMTQAKRYIDALIECNEDPKVMWDKYRHIEQGEW